MSSLPQATPADKKTRLLASIKRACARKAKQRYGRPVTAKRLQSIQGLLLRGANRIWSLGFHIDDVSRIEDEHLQALVDDLKSAGFSESTVVAYQVAFHALAAWQGRILMSHHEGKS